MVKPKIAVVWGKWGPYHHARFNKLAQTYGKDSCLGVAIAGLSETYEWKPVHEDMVKGRVVTLNPEEAQENVRPFKIGKQVFSLCRKEKIKVVFVISYWPTRYCAVLLAARLAGARCVMMNESHAATERAHGIKRWIKRQLIKLFDSALVGGTLHKQHFANLGVPEEKMFFGYDAVDNDYFKAAALSARSQVDVLRHQHGLPEHYILNLGRMVKKKNLPLLIEAYARFSEHQSSAEKNHALVLIGSGPEEENLRSLALRLGLRVVNLTPDQTPTDSARTVFFGGFRQIDENPIFFALADVFVLPSHTEEWGLVVN
ncbi:MAG: glycosyltransferase, partial [Proteobacteria bacterium]